MDRSNVTEYTFRSHTGTHIDAPYHYYPDGMFLDDIPLERFRGRGFVVPMHKRRLEAITTDDLTPYADRIRSLPFVMLSFGWAKYYGSEEYYNHPYISEDAAKTLVDLKVGCVAIDTLTPDVPIPLRQPGYKGPAHLTLLGGDVLIIENLNSMQELENQFVNIYAFPVRIKHSDGAPVRVIAEIE
ncbi:cyclase family protein [Alicyclobacillus acidoterrestris]|uniref:cyclase family protein n=1 Tax=Alicyclobacillus acidoterrestris TaxID=1450 RepID=UPI003F530AEE